jgi:hypothetical protein
MTTLDKVRTTHTLHIIQYVTFKAFMAVTMKNAVFWVAAHGFLYPEYGDDTFLRNVGLHNI